jgi:hypothetical protein
VYLRPLSTFARGPKVERIVGYFIFGRKVLEQSAAYVWGWEREEI